MTKAQTAERACFILMAVYGQDCCDPKKHTHQEALGFTGKQSAATYANLHVAPHAYPELTTMAPEHQKAFKALDQTYAAREQQKEELKREILKKFKKHPRRGRGPQPPLDGTEEI